MRFSGLPHGFSRAYRRIIVGTGCQKRSSFCFQSLSGLLLEGFLGLAHFLQDRQRSGDVLGRKPRGMQLAKRHDLHGLRREFRMLRPAHRHHAHTRHGGWTPCPALRLTYRLPAAPTLILSACAHGCADKRQRRDQLGAPQ
jgi:hypothetical protein